MEESYGIRKIISEETSDDVSWVPEQSGSTLLIDGAAVTRESHIVNGVE